jgi:hypothetical protein
MNLLKIGLAEKHFEYTLAELDEKLRQMCLLMETEAAGCNYEDAEVRASENRISASNATHASTALSSTLRRKPQSKCGRHSSGRTTSTTISHEALVPC